MYNWSLWNIMLKADNAIRRDFLKKGSRVMIMIKKYGWVLFPFSVLFWAVGFGLMLGAGNENVEPYQIGKGGDSPFNSFEAYTFRHNQHRCFVVVKMDGNIDLDCP